MVNVANRKVKGRDSARRSGFKYVKRDPEAIRKRAERKGGRYDSPFSADVDVFRPKEGDNAIRILPPTWDNHEHFGYTVFAHRYIGPEESTYLCPRKMKNKPCAVCDACEECRRSGETDEAKRLQPTEMQVYWILDRAENAKVPQVYMVHWMADRDIAGFTRNPKSGAALYVDHPDDGYDLLIRRTGSGLRTRYTYSFDREASPIHESEKTQEKILEYIQDNPIPKMLKYFPNDYLERLISGTTPEKDEDLDDDDDTDERDRDAEDEQEDREARASKGKKKKARRPARDDEVDDDDDADAGEADDKGRASRRASRASRDADDDDGDDDDAPFDEDESDADEDGDSEDDGDEDVVEATEDEDEDEGDSDADEDEDGDSDADEDEDEDEAPRKRKPERERPSVRAKKNGRGRSRDDEDERPRKPKRIERVRREPRREERRTRR